MVCYAEVNRGLHQGVDGFLHPSAVGRCGFQQRREVRATVPGGMLTKGGIGRRRPWPLLLSRVVPRGVRHVIRVEGGIRQGGHASSGTDRAGSSPRAT